MTAPELVHQIKDAGGSVWMTVDRQLHVRNVPREFLPKLRRLKADVVRHIEGENYRRLVKTFNLKKVSRDRMGQITNGQPWQIFNTAVPEKKSTFTIMRERWEAQQAELHGCRYVDGECVVHVALGPNRAPLPWMAILFQPKLSLD